MKNRATSLQPNEGFGPSERDDTDTAKPAGNGSRDASLESTPSGDILVVDDDPANLVAIEVALGDLGRRLVKVQSGHEALRQLLHRDFALILLDIQMPDLDGFETARFIRQRERSRHVPIIFVTAFSHDDDAILKGYSLGAVDFLFKPIVPEVLHAKAGVFVELQERNAEIRRQAERLRELERREADRRLAEERQRWEAEALREENRRKDEFIAILAHELRNPLAPLVTSLELIRLYGGETPEMERIRSTMERQVHHLTRLVDDLLDVSRISRGKSSLQLADIDLRDAVRQAVESSRPLIDERSQKLTVDESDSPLWVAGDTVRLVQVVSNLLNNAARYTEPEGRIGIATRKEGGDAVVRVVDDGCGIPPEMLESIFDMFVQEHQGEKGLGLGLTLVHSLVALHGGEVQALSDGRGQGSTFEVRIPLLLHPPNPDRTVHEDLEEKDAEPLEIVVVDDEEDIREAIRALLEGWGHSVRVAADGQEGYELVVESRPDVALLDIGMPKMDGYQAAREIRDELGEETPRLVAMTGFGREQDREKARRAGFDAHLTKPAPPRLLRQALRSS